MVVLNYGYEEDALTFVKVIDAKAKETSFTMCGQSKFLDYQIISRVPI